MIDKKKHVILIYMHFKPEGPKSSWGDILQFPFERTLITKPWFQVVEVRPTSK